MTHPRGAQSGYPRTPLSAEEKARGEANFGPLCRRGTRGQRAFQGVR